jgi:tetracycline 7-halogenase / FADH2 O2-dependent halogenase
LTCIYDIAVVGSGFAGSLIAMIAKRLGHSVVLLERGKHPRVVIGESSTPLANLLLDDLTTRYNLPVIKPFAKWGSWQRTYPQVGCGLKRGFTFYHHQLGIADAHDPTRSNQLLVAASPHDEIADTHWYRADFDAMLVSEAQTLGVDYLDEVEVDRIVDHGKELHFEVTKAGATSNYCIKFLIDATGPRGLLHHAFALPEAELPNYPETQALYSHFSGVALPDEKNHVEELPYPPEAAAVHHVFDGGWIWVLRFNNGITSAGVAATKAMSEKLGLHERETAWLKLLDSIPSLKKQFASAHAVQPFRYLPKLSFLSGCVSGERWAMLPSAAGFVDPLLSTGFPLTLLGIDRLARILERDWDSTHFASQLQAYATQTTAEVLATSRLIGSLYANMSNFQVFSSLTLLYFAAASYSETVQRLGKAHLSKSFLLHEHPGFGPVSKALIERAMHLSSVQESVRFREDVLRAIEPIDVAGLSNPNKRGWYPVVAEDLLNSATKVGSTHEEIALLLERCGFYQFSKSH